MCFAANRFMRLLPTANLLVEKTSACFKGVKRSDTHSFKSFWNSAFLNGRLVLARIL